jgi:hypothetical protein
MIGVRRFVGAAVAAFVLLGHSPASAGCQVISATHSASSKIEALRMSQGLAAESAERTRRARGWRHVTMRPRRVQPDPFWKSVRPVVPRHALLKPDVVTARTYTTCFTGVVVPYVCTSGSTVCGN